MIIRNTHADYSANNIGVLDIPVELNPTAAAIVAQYTNQTLSNVKKGALNVLTSTLQTAGIWSKINMLLMPCLASSVTEAYLDVINHDATMVNAHESDYVTNNLALNSNGYGIYQSSTPSAINLSPAKSSKTFSGTASVFSAIRVLVDANFGQGGIGHSDTQTCWYCKSGNTHSTRRGNANTGIGVNGATWLVNNNYAEVCTYTIGSELSASNYFDYINGTKQAISVKSSVSINGTDLNSAKICPFFPTQNATTFENGNPVAIWGAASGLSDAESKTLCDALTAFQSAFFA